MNVKKATLCSIIALTLIGCVIAAGCVSDETISTSTTTTVYDSDGNLISSSESGSYSINTDTHGKLTVSITDQDPVVGIWADDDILLILSGNSSATAYGVDENKALYNPQNPQELKWGKVQSMDNTYLISNKSSFNMYVYSPAEDTLSLENDPTVVLKRTEIEDYY